MQRFRLSGRAGRTHALEAAAEHRGIYDAIAGGDVEAAERLMRAHIEEARRRTLTDERAAGAGTAEPPARNTSTPAALASECGEVTMPFGASVAGRPVRISVMGKVLSRFPRG